MPSRALLTGIIRLSDLEAGRFFGLTGVWASATSEMVKKDSKIAARVVGVLYIVDK